MALYNSALKTHVIDPVRDIANSRTEFRLGGGDSVYLSNMRLMNLGVITDRVDEYNALTGCYGMIKQMSLYDGSTLLDQILSAQQLMGFRLYNKSNDKARDQSRYLAKNELGFMFDGKDFGAQAVTIPFYTSEQARTRTNTAEDTTNKGWLSLREAFPMLKEALYLPTRVFKNLRLVVQYDTDADNIVQQVNATVVTKQTEPILVVDELVDEQVSMQVTNAFKELSYRSIEYDSVVVPSITPTAGNPNPVQTVNFNINGFDNKFVNRIMMANFPVTKISDYVGDSYSQNMINQKVQFRINGANKAPRDGDGWNRPNQRLARVVDTWGECVNVPGGNSTGINDSSNIGNALVQDLVGKLDYTGIVIGDRVNEMQLTYTRTGMYTNTAPENEQTFNQAIRLQLYGEVEKQLMVNPDGTYNVMYA